MRHGYKGAFEMAATVDYLFGYEATAEVVDDWMYEEPGPGLLCSTPRSRSSSRRRTRGRCSASLRRLFEAAERGLWEHPPEDLMAELRRLYWELDAYLEAWRETRVQARSAAGVAPEAERKEVS